MAERAARERYGGSYGPEWEPGDPLWVHPMRDWQNDYSQVTRYLCDLLEDDEVGRWNFAKATLTACHRCHVAWNAAGPDGAFCWVCGAKGTPPGREPQVAA